MHQETVWPWGLPSPLYSGNGFFLRGKAAEAWRYHQPQCRNKVKERVELFVCSPHCLLGMLWGEILW